MKKTFFILTGIATLSIGCMDRGKTSPDLAVQAKNSLDTIKAVTNAVPPPKLPSPKNQDSLKVFLGRNRTLDEYVENLKVFENRSQNKEHAPSNLLEGIVPINDTEFGHFYSLSYPEEYPESNLDLYWAINDAMEQSALSNQGNCIYLYLNLAEFVDGEYAESFSYIIPVLAEKHQSKFCNVYHELSERSKYILEDIFDDYCE